MDDTTKLNKLNGLFSALVDMYKELTDSQVEERKYVKEKFAEYQEFYNIDVRELQDEIDDLKSKLVIADLDLKREKSKSALLMSIKESRHGRDKFRLGFVESTIKALLDFIEHSCGEKEKSEVSRLLSDVGSTYTQNMESEDTSFQRSKCMEVEDADEKVDKLKPSMEQLLSLNTEKDETILKLEDDIGSKRVEVEQANEKLENLQTSMEELQSTMREKDELIVILQGQAEKLDPILLDMEEWILLHKEKEEIILKLEDDIGSKCIEVEQANEKIEKLRTSMEQLQSSISGKDETIVILKGEVEQTNKKLDKLATSMQHLESSNTRKDETIVKLKADLAKFEEETNKSKREPSKLSEKVDILRKSEGASLMPVLNLCNGPLTRSTARQKRSMEIPTNKSKREPSKLSEKVEILRKSEGASLMPVLNSCNGPLTRSMARQKRSMEIPTTSHALEGVSLAPVMMSCTTKPCTQVRRPRRSQVTRPVSKIESLGLQVFDIGKTEMKESITGKRKPDENNSILGQQPRTRKKHCSSL